MKISIFIDALDPRDVQKYCPKMALDMKGKYDVGVPRVTPNIVSQAMTGLPPEDMEMIRSTPMFEPGKESVWETEEGEPKSVDSGPERDGIGDPVQGERRVGVHRYQNILDDLDSQGVTLFQYGTPFCAFVELDNGLSVHDEMTNPAVPGFMEFVSPQTSFKDDDWDLVADSYISDTVLHFETLKQITRQGNMDAIFLGYKHIDHCTHWYAPDIKRDLIKVIWSYIEDLREMGHEVMWWSDHGSQSKKEVFRINKWLHENEYLKYDVDLQFLEQARNKGMIEQSFDEQVQLQSPVVEVDWESSVAYSSDAFDSLVDVTPHASDGQINQLVQDLGSHPATANVWRKGEYLDPEGEKFWYAPEIIVERDDNVLVTGNIHPDASTYISDVPEDWEDFQEDNMGMRPGVHSRYGCYGGDIPEDTDISEPCELRDVMYDFVDPENIESGNVDTDISQAAEERLEDLGYI